ncbi:hypothetical protein BA6E_125612 [Bacteroidales bacterium 6E]|nr:hypothetical protein BA6E_125612 [Bacteroidales bacterium 6E]
MRIAEVTMFILVILLTLSVGLNVFQYTGRKVNSDPVPEIIQVSDTMVRIDTIFKEVTQKIVVEKPVPVYVDTTANVRTYRDTIFLPYGTIKGEQIVFGELLKRDLQFDMKIPEIYRTLEVNNTVIRSVSQRMLFATVGVRTDFNHYASPFFGVAFIPNGHRYLFGVEVGVDQQVSGRLGLGIFK